MIIKKLKKITTYEIRQTKNNKPTDSVWATHNTIKDAITDINEKVHKWFKGCGRPKNKEDYCVVQVDKTETWITNEDKLC